MVTHNMSPSTRTQTDSCIPLTTIPQPCSQTQSGAWYLVSFWAQSWKLTARAQDVWVSLVLVFQGWIPLCWWNTLTGLWCQYIKLFARMVTGDDNILGVPVLANPSMVWTPPCYTRPNSLEILWQDVTLGSSQQNSRKEFTLGMRPTSGGWEEGPGKSIETI